MSVERTYYCDGPDCGDEEHGSVHARTTTPPPHLPMGMIEVRSVEPGSRITNHFCGWDCLMKFAANQPLPEVIDTGGDQ